MMVTNNSDTTLAIIATINITMKPNDNVTAIPISGSKINITTAATSAAIIIAPSSNKNLIKGLHTSLPLMIIRVFIRGLSRYVTKNKSDKNSKVTGLRKKIMSPEVLDDLEKIAEDEEPEK